MQTIQLSRKQEQPKKQLIWVPLKNIRDTYVMKRKVTPKKRAWIKNDIRDRGLKDALEATPSKKRGIYDLTGGYMRKTILAELFKAHTPIFYRPTRQRITEGKLPVIATITPLSPYQAHLEALRDNIDRRTVTEVQVGEYVIQLLNDDKLPWGSRERRDRILQISQDMNFTDKYLYNCISLVTDSSPMLLKEAKRGKVSHGTLRAIKGIGNPRHKEFLEKKALDGLDAKHIAQLAAVLERDAQRDQPFTNARMEDTAKKLMDAPDGLGIIDIVGLPFIKDAKTRITVVASLTCSKGHKFTHIVCPMCLEEQIAGKESCSQCPACSNQVEISTMAPTVHITMDSKELNQRLSAHVQRTVKA